jgi:hypothetical protein
VWDGVSALLRLVLALAAACGPPRQTFDAAPVGADPVQIASEGECDEDASVVRTQDGRFRAVWWSKRNGQVDLFTRVSDDGITWTDEKAITNDLVEDYYPSLIQSRDGTFHLAWFRLVRNPVRKDIWYARSQDGRTWTRPVRISTTGVDWAPVMYEDSFGLVWIVWSSARSGNRELYTVRSGDGGRTWSHFIRLTESPEEDDFPAVLAGPNDERTLAWTRYAHGSKQDDYYRDGSAEVVTATSKDGLHWSAPITQSPPDPDNGYLDMLPWLFGDKDGRHTYLAWTSSRPSVRGAIVVRELTSPDAPIHQLTTSRGSDYGARIVPAGQPGAYLMVWTSGRGGAMRVFARGLLL